MGANYTNANLAVKDKKREVLELIETVKVFCFNFPPTNLNVSLPSFEADFDVIAYLMDLISTIVGKKSKELELEITNWLINRIEPLEKEIRFNLKSQLKSCYACKINPRIAPWMFVIDPTTNQPGTGINIEIDQFDWACMLKINPRSDVGRTLYGGPSDMNEFLYDVIQAGGSPVQYFDPVTNKHVATFTYVETNAPVGGTAGSPQTTDYRNNVINLKIPNSYNDPNKNLIDFINDYLNSFVLFNTPKAITQSMDLIFGVLTRKIKMDSGCVEKQVEFDALIGKMADCGLDDPNLEVDDSFFEFSDDEVTNIKKQARDKQLGIKVYGDCVGCNGTPASIDFESVLELNDNLESASDKAEKVEIIREGLQGLANTSTSSVSNNNDKNQAKYTFLEELIRALKVTIMRLTLSPKVVYLFISMYYMVEGQARHRGVKEWFQNLICLLRDILRKLLEELVRFLLILVLRGLKLLIKKYIKFKFEQKMKDFIELKKSFLPNIQGCGPLSDILSNPAGLAYAGVDAGFDQAENAVAQKNNNQNSG
jgi:hypothetical protein